MRSGRKAIAGWGCLLVVAALAGCGGARVDTGGHPSQTSAKTDPPATKTSAPGDLKTTAVKTPNGRVDVAEVRDPEEAKSFPLPASVHHRSASAPSVAGEAVVAAGAPSDAEVKRELNEMHAVERAAAQTQRQELTPVAGGESVGGNGTIPIPSGVPEVVQKVIAGGNAIADFPYIWGGGHASFIANGYDCSGSVSYALHGGGLLSSPEDSTGFETYGDSGPGKWITLYADSAHVFVVIAGRAFDTADYGGPNIPSGTGPRWRYNPTGNLADGGHYIIRHPAGL